MKLDNAAKKFLMPLDGNYQPDTHPNRVYAWNQQKQKKGGD